MNWKKIMYIPQMSSQGPTIFHQANMLLIGLS